MRHSLYHVYTEAGPAVIGIQLDTFRDGEGHRRLSVPRGLVHSIRQLLPAHKALGIPHKLLHGLLLEGVGLICSTAHDTSAGAMPLHSSGMLLVCM